jgi:hypothetical protein
MVDIQAADVEDIAIVATVVQAGLRSSSLRSSVAHSISKMSSCSWKLLGLVSLCYMPPLLSCCVSFLVCRIHVIVPIVPKLAWQIGK